MKLALKIFAGGILVVLVWCGGVASDYFDPNSIPHIAMRTQLQLFGEAIYEYHSSTGRWPTKLDDLQSTSLPAKSPVWRQSAIPLVLLWPQDLKADPRENAGVLLAYHEGGLFNKLGRVWVCFGDLRTERMAEQELKSRLRR